jgi:hypothetical protein
MEEYVVTLRNKEDLDDFYNDMETPGGDLYIPDRAVNVELRRQISRNTHYMLTPEEVIELKQDPRVWDVKSANHIRSAQGSYDGFEEGGTFDRQNYLPVAGDKNWGLYRHVIGANALSGEWGFDGTDAITVADYAITASGKNVDVLIVDSVINTTAMNHPEFAVNADGTGGTRFKMFNWFGLNSALGYGVNGTYDYSDDGETHGIHVAGTAAGNTQGWARDADIYNIQPFGQNHGSGKLDPLKYWDYIRQWHNNKTINSETGRRNPTISNHSYALTHGRISGTYIQAEDDGSADTVTGIGVFRYRGSIYDKWGDAGSDLSDAELRARGIVIDATGDFRIPFWSAAMQADVDDAADDGIIFVTSAGNSKYKITKSGDQDYNNLVYWRVGGNQYADNDPSHRPVSGNGGSHPDAINVGSLDITKNDRKASFSNCGNAVNIHAAGYGIISARGDNTGHFLDSRNTSFSMQKQSGTSMSAPQVCGVLALLAESNPGLNQAEAKAWLEANATNDIMYDTGTDNSQDFESLQGGFNKVLRWINQRPESGASFPKVNAKARPTSGLVYPRPRIRRRG